jgi:predicted secreted protein
MYCLFVSHCVLAQCVMAEGRVKTHPSMVEPVVRFCLENSVNIMQMPCPETRHAGLERQPRGKGWYEAHGLRSSAAAIAEGQAEYMGQLVASGSTILGVAAIEFSPACAVHYLNRGSRIVPGTGIYIEELRRALLEHDLDVPIVGISPRWPAKAKKDLTALLPAVVS